MKSYVIERDRDSWVLRRFERFVQMFADEELYPGIGRTA